MGEVFAACFHGQINPGSGDGGFDLGSRADDARILEQLEYLGFAEFCDLARIEAFERLAEGLALFQHRDPGKSRLKAVEHQRLPQYAAVALRGSPLLIVIGTHERIAFGPGTTLLVLRMACHLIPPGFLMVAD